MTKLELINKISMSTGIEKSVVSNTIENFFTVVQDSLEDGDNVYFRGFGTFHLQHRKAKIARNIKKNTSIKLAARNIPKFKPSKSFVEKIINSTAAQNK